jgi:preprotein translocase subunit SecE
MSQQRFVILTFVIGAILFGMVVQSALSAAMLQFSVTDDRLLGGLVSTSALLGILGGAAGFVVALRNKEAVKFTDEVIGELRKVTWPSREETVRATTTVVLTTIFVAALLGLYDLMWKRVADLFLFTEG